jgi:hypothetical protein
MSDTVPRVDLPGGYPYDLGQRDCTYLYQGSMKDKGHPHASPIIPMAENHFKSISDQILHTSDNSWSYLGLNLTAQTMSEVIFQVWGFNGAY